MSNTFANAQPSLTLTQLIVETGIFPQRDGGGALGIPMGSIRTFAGSFAIGSPGTEMAQGQIRAIAQNTALFSLVGTTFGGNGQTTFGLPNLDGRIMVGTGTGPGLSDMTVGQVVGSNTLTLSQTQTPASAGGSGLPFDNRGPELGVTYAIMVEGIYPSQDGAASSFIGEVMPFATNFAPAGWLQAAGQLLPISQYDTLYSVLGTTYGGDGVSTFALPDLRGRAVMGVGVGAGDRLGAVVGAETHTITTAELSVAQGGSGAAIDNRAPSLELNYLIATQGIFPSRDGGGIVPDEQTIGEVVATASNVVPRGWALANGQLLPIAQNQALFSILGTAYGGDGRVTFALPDLRGKVMLGSGTNASLGQVTGSNFTSLVYTNEAPVVAGSAGPGFTENGSAAAIATGVTATTVDNVNFTNASLTMALTSGSVSGDVVAIGTTAAISVSGSTVSYDADGAGGAAPVAIGTSTVNSATSTTVVFNGNATAAAVKALSEAFTFSNPGENPGSGARTATLTLVDAGGTANGGHDTGSTTISIAVTAVNDAPTLTVPGAPYTQAGALTGISFADVDAGAGTETVTFTVGAGALTTTASSGVTLGGTATARTATGTIADLNAFISGGHLSYAGPSTTLGVSINDQGNSGSGTPNPQSASANVAINTNSPPSVPVDSNAAANTVAEGAAAGTTVGVTASATDPESSPVTYTLTSNANGAFAINGTSGVVTVADPTKIDYESAHSLSITVQASDGSATSTQTFSIALTDINDTAPVVTSGATGAEAENTAAANVVYQAVATDADTVGAVTFSLGGTDAAAFNITAAGAVTFKAAPNFESPTDAGANNVYDITVTASDGVNTSAPKAVAITVSNVNEAPTAAADTGAATEDGGAVTLTAATLLANDTDPDAGDTKTIVSAQAIGGTTVGSVSLVGGNVVYNPGTNFQSLKAGATTTDSFTYTMEDAAHVQSTATVTMTITGVNDAPTAVADTGAATEDGGAVTLTAATLLANDTDADSGDTKTIVSAQAIGGTTVGSVSLVGGNVVYNPGANFQSLKAGATATDSFTYTMEDAAHVQSTATVTMTIAGVNDAPAAVADTGAATEDGGAVTLTAATLLANDTDADSGDTKTIVSAQAIGGTTVGSVSLVGGNVVYNPGTNFQSLKAGATTTDSFTYTMEDAAHVQSTATVTMTITGVNDAPAAVADTGAATEDGGAVTLTAATLLANDTDVDSGDTKTIVSAQAIGGTTVGSVSLVGGAVVYNPGTNFQSLKAGATTTDSFTYTMEDAAHVQSTATVTMTITGVNDAPVAVADTGAATEDGGAVTLTSATLLANDTDADAGDTKTIVSAQAIGGTTVGSVSLVGGNVVYNPGTNFQSLKAGATTTDSFTYTMEDAAHVQSTATVTMTITGINDAPVAVADTGAATEDGGAVTLTSATLLANDTDADAGDTKTIVSAQAIGGTTVGSVSLVGGNVVYNPGTNFQSLKAGATTTDSFTYTMEDAAHVQSTATVTMTITGVNDAPTAVADTGAATEDGGAVTLTAATLLANDTDVDSGDTKTIVSAQAIGGTTVGSVSLVGGNVVYNPGANFQSLKAGATTTDSFTYTMEDAAHVQSTATVTMTITGVNDAPAAVADTGAATEDGGAVTLTSATLLANDTDADAGDTKTIVSAQAIGGTTVGSVSVVGGNVVYNPGANFQSLQAGATTTDSFTYTMEDAAHVQSTATVTMTVAGVNDAPVAVADTGAGFADRTATLTVASLLANDTDVDSGDTKTFVSVQVAAGVTRGTVSLVGGDVVYNPGNNFLSYEVGQTAHDSFTYTIRDAAGSLSTATVTMNIAGTYEPPAPPSPPTPPRFPTVDQDTLTGSSLNDTFAGGAGDDSLFGGDGSDKLDGDVGNDSVSGGDGGDFLRGLDDNDKVDGGAGDDTVNGNKGDDSVTGGDGADVVYGGQGSDYVDGGAGNDSYVNGNIGDDIVHGGTGDDSVYGGQGGDSVYGDAGDDRISGDLGDDVVYGGGGADRFVFGANSGNDWIADFDASQGDRIQINPGVTYTVSYFAGQVLISLSDGGVIGLAGVGVFSTDWIVTA